MLHLILNDFLLSFRCQICLASKEERFCGIYVVCKDGYVDIFNITFTTDENIEVDDLVFTHGVSC